MHINAKGLYSLLLVIEKKKDKMMHHSCHNCIAIGANSISQTFEVIIKHILLKLQMPIATISFSRNRQETNCCH